ncbi:MAG: CocE/NonD family hydrolase [Caldilineaceae bacterium]
MAEPAFTFFRSEYTAPEPFPAALTGTWQQAACYPLAQTTTEHYYLGAGTLEAEPAPTTGIDHYVHRPTLGTNGSLCWGGGAVPNGLARDLRPDEAHSLTYTSTPLDNALDIVGFPQAHLYLRATAPVAHVVVRLTDVAPDGTSVQVSVGVLNLTHRDSHTAPSALNPDTVYPVTIDLRAIAYRFLPDHCIRLSVASAWWPVIWPSPYPADNYLYRGAAYPAALRLPTIPSTPASLQPPLLKTTAPELQEIGESKGDSPVWQVIQDVLRQAVTVKVYGGGESILPNGIRIFDSELLEMTAYEQDPARVLLYNEVLYQLDESGYRCEVRTTGTTRSTEQNFHIDIQLRITLNGNYFFEKTWLESFPRQLL